MWSSVYLRNLPYWKFIRKCNTVNITGYKRYALRGVVVSMHAHFWFTTCYSLNFGFNSATKSKETKNMILG